MCKNEKPSKDGVIPPPQLKAIKGLYSTADVYVSLRLPVPLTECLSKTADWPVAEASSPDSCGVDAPLQLLYFHLGRKTHWRRIKLEPGEERIQAPCSWRLPAEAPERHNDNQAASSKSHRGHKLVSRSKEPLDNQFWTQYLIMCFELPLVTWGRSYHKHVYPPFNN